MFPANDRRDFLKHAAALGAIPLLENMTQAGAHQHRAIVVWLAHTIITPLARGRVFDQALIQEVVSQRRIDEKFFGDVFARCADHGLNTVYIAPRYVGKAFYRSKVVAVFDRMYGDEGAILADVLQRFDPYDVSVREAKRRGLKVIAQTSLFDHWFPGLEDRYYEQHPELLMVDRQGQRLYFQGVPCYAEPGAQDYCLAEIKELVERGAEGISFEMDSHQSDWWPPGYGERSADSFGFNPPLVKEFQNRYGVNVLKEEFDRQKWYALHGEFFTRFLRRVKNELKDKSLTVGITPEGFLAYGANASRVVSFGYVSQAPACRIDLEWRKWLEEGIVDGVRLYVADPYAVAIAEAMKRQHPQGKFYLNILKVSPPELRRLKKQLADSKLDGYVIHEEAHFDANPELWNALR
jgi:uncharacterized lipoprotein YddW (UPF0748 family)